ncbi:hypothetical protein M0813_00226 [Anaeramoeba flamelloides]|uniref:Single-stranded DNA binding protein n=1 Tax=Anaeramoeba flamelloides TaxID=1746091 RepID=A0ABQ8Y9P4_9EUKA|nr:hypothetical protein M0813_00226 [Anaeramoeba flamelloides]
MQNLTKPFPQHLNPIILGTTNWVIKEKIQTKKLYLRSTRNLIFYVFDMDRVVPKKNRGDTLLLVMVGRFNSRKNKKKQKKISQNHNPFVIIDTAVPEIP